MTCKDFGKIMLIGRKNGDHFSSFLKLFLTYKYFDLALVTFFYFIASFNFQNIF